MAARLQPYCVNILMKALAILSPAAWRRIRVVYTLLSDRVECVAAIGKKAIRQLDR